MPKSGHFSEDAHGLDAERTLGGRSADINSEKLVTLSNKKDHCTVIIFNNLKMTRNR